MIDDITIIDESVIGTVKDLKEYFRYEIAHQCMTTEFNFEDFNDNVRDILYLLENLENEDNDIKIEVYNHPTGGLTYARI